MDTDKVFLIDVEVTHRLRFRVGLNPKSAAVDAAKIEALNICPVQVMDSEILDKVLDSQITYTEVKEIED